MNRKSRMTPYRFVTTWHVAAPVEKVWDALQCVTQWWPGMVSSRHLTPGREGVGARYERITRGRLPYTLRYVLTITSHDPPYSSAYDSEGDLVGEGAYLLTQTGSTTEVRFTWNVATRSRWMNAVAPMLKPLFAWNHNYVMRQGEKAIQRYLAASQAHAAMSSPPIK
ncbi:MAG TPA: SRPBCC family protein [Pirellulales bacterium]|nr:SRPBCC family protein [Pirellulales bacterium]